MKQKTNESDIIVYDIREDYSARTSSSSTKPADKGEEKRISVPEQEHGVTGPTTLLGGFTGKVYDKLTFRRVEGALVTIVKNLSVKTDEKGEFVITNIKPGKYRVTVSEDGYVVQSRKSTAVAGVTTKLDSFHLIPDCLADDYPDDIVEEEEPGEEYIVEEETAAPAVESIPPTSTEEISCAPETVDAKIEEEEAIKIVLGELSEKPTRVSSDVVSVEDVDRETAPDSETRETTTEENPIECSETDAGEEALSDLEETAEEHVVIASAEEMKKILSDEIVSMPVEEIQTPATAADSTETVMALPEEKDSTEATMPVSEGLVVGDISSVDELSPMSIETGIAEAVQPEEVPQELSVKKTQLRIPWMTWFRRKLKRKFSGKDPLEPPVEVVPEITVHEAVLEEAHQVELSADVSVADEIVSISIEEIQTPAIAADSTETVMALPEEKDFTETLMSAPEGVVVGDISSIDELPRISIETGITEVTQSEEAPQELSVSVKEASFVAVVEEMVQEKAEEKVYEEELIEPSMGVTLEITAYEAVLEEIYQEELSVGVFVSDEFVSMPVEEIQTLAIAADSTEIFMAAPEETIIKVDSSVDELPHMFIEIGIAEVTQPEEAPQELSVEEAYQEEPSIDAFVSDEIVSMPAEGIQPPAIAADSIEVVMSAPEEIVVGDVSSVDEHISIETGIAEVTQPEDAPQELSVKESQSRLPWKRWGKNKAKRTFSRQDLLKPSLEDVLKSIANKKVLEETLQGKPIEPPIDVVPEVAAQEVVVEGTLQKEPSADVSVEEIAEYRAMHEVITGLNKEKRAAEVTSAIEDRKEEVCETITEEKPIGYSESYIFAEGPVVPEGIPEGISDDDIASVSEEERAAMSRVHNSVEVAGFVGVINAQPNPAYKGLPINIAYTLRNVACDDPDDLIVQIIVINPDTGIIYEILETPVKCRKGTFSMGGFVIFTTSYETYAYRLNMQIVSEKTKTSHLLTGISLEVKSIF